ncbi:MAG: SDR family NAD(P)-dependent oxidoreductase [Thermoanaerobaculia bacterium]
MTNSRHRAIAIVGVGAVLPDAPDAPTFWENVKQGRYSISEVPRERWDPDLFWDPDPKAPDKSYSKIGGWVKEWAWEPLKWNLPIPPKVGEAMDRTQKWALVGARQALADYGYPERPLDRERVAVILGNAMGGDLHYETATRISYPEIAREQERAPSFAELPEEVRARLRDEFSTQVGGFYPRITEDTMPGELANIIAGRVANLFDFHGPNYVVDAACASAMAAIHAAIEGLEEEDYDAVLTGGIDANMSAATYTKFCKIGALSATGTRPFADGADGFVMGEGAAIFLLKRLRDAERDGDQIYAVIRGLGGSSDGRGKGITAPNPVGQRLAVERAWNRAGLVPDQATLIEGHGTSTRVGDVVEVQCLTEAFVPFGFAPGSLPLGSVKSNIGHLKGAAGAAGILKTVYALRDRVLPPSLGFERPNPNIDFSRCPFFVNTELRPWEAGEGQVRRAGVSAFGFGGTNFHAVLEEYIPGQALDREAPAIAVARELRSATDRRSEKLPLRGALVLGGDSAADLEAKLREVLAKAESGEVPEIQTPAEADLRAPVRLAIDYGDGAELIKKAGRALSTLQSGKPETWKALRGRGIFLGAGKPSKVAMLFTGQGSQYLNMLRQLASDEPVVAETFREADEVMRPLLGRPLTDYLFVDPKGPLEQEAANDALRQTAITQPAVLTTDIALQRLLGSYGVMPDMVMGHSLGEYGALVAAGAISFAHALEAVSARGREMSRISTDDNGWMAAVFAPLEEIERLLSTIDGYVVVANINSYSEAVIGGASKAVERAIEALQEAGYQAQRLPVSHAFHTQIVAPSSDAVRQVLGRMGLQPPEIPTVANVSGDFYPMGPGVEPQMIEILGRQVAEPVQFVKGLESLYRAGTRVFVECGPKRALQGMVRSVFQDHDDTFSLSTNHPRLGDVASFNQALCGLYAAGLGVGTPPVVEEPIVLRPPEERVVVPPADSGAVAATASPGPGAFEVARLDSGTYHELGQLFAGFLERGLEVVGRRGGASSTERPVVVTGAAIGLPGTARVFDDSNLGRLFDGQQFIGEVPGELRQKMVEKNITRLVKSENGGPRFETIEGVDEVIKLAARRGDLDLVDEFGFPSDRLEALDIVTELAIGSGLDALRDAGLPLVRRYKTTTKGSKLPEQWGLADEVRDETGVIFASAFPGVNYFARESDRFYTAQAAQRRLDELQDLRSHLSSTESVSEEALNEVDRRLEEAREEVAATAYTFDRRFLFRLLSMGHSQMAEFIGARGPNTQINSACASGTQAIGLAADWIRAGRCRRVVIVSADDVTSDDLMGWIGAGFLATGAAATDAQVEDAAIPFDRRRHGMLVGMGAAAIVVESEEAAHERGIQPICEVLATVTANSAFHGTRLDVTHITEMMQRLISDAEEKWGIDRFQIAEETAFISHETYTPARGGSAQAEIFALRSVFGEAADKIVIANTKGYTGHPMGVGIEDVLAIKSLETGLVPAVANFKEIDPELGELNLSRGGSYPVRYALRLAAGFGSQISMVLLRWVPAPGGQRPKLEELGYDYRCVEPERWQQWLDWASGHPGAEVEVEHRTLRVRDEGPPSRAMPRPEASHRKAVSRTVNAAPFGRPATDIRPDTARVQASAKVSPATVVSPPKDASETPSARQAGGLDPIQKRVLEIVAETTGYPEEMLDLDLDMEADLGIDTVKQAEMFAAIREEWSIPRDDTLQLRDYPTLARAIQFVYERRPDLGEQAPIVDAEAPAGEASVEESQPAASGTAGIPDTGEAQESLPVTRSLTRPIVGSEEAASKVPRRVPAAMLLAGLDLCKKTGVKLKKGSRVVVMADRGGIGKALAQRLERLGVEVLFLEAETDGEQLTSRLATWQKEGDIQGVYWLPALDATSEISDLTAEEWQQAVTRSVKLLFWTAKELYDSLAHGGSFFISATRLGGRHGYDEAGAWAPLGGGVAGLTKALKRERPTAVIKVVDFEPSRATAAPADRLIEETLRDPGSVEVGYCGAARSGVGLVDAPLGSSVERAELDSATVFVVTGAAGSIVSAIVADLAASSKGVFHLLDLAPEPNPADEDLQQFRSDPEALRIELFERMKAEGKRATPAKVERELSVLERARAALTALESVEAAGGQARYHCVDLLDGEAVDRVIAEVRERHGRIDVLIHAAGLEISHALSDKSGEEFDLVFDVKSQGWFHLLKSASDMPVGATVAFSSIAGRFGNAGQTDYSAANDLLCKLTSNLRTSRPETRGVAIDWTAWSGIGMASRGSIPKMMELAGIGMLAPEAGVPIVRRELEAGTRGEVVVAEDLGVLLEDSEPEGGLDAETIRSRQRGPMISGFEARQTPRGLVAVGNIVPTEQPFLDDHRIDGTAVLPGVMGIEAFAEASRLLAPNRQVIAVEEVVFLSPFKFYRDEARSLEIEAFLGLESEEVVASCRLVGRRQLAKQSEEKETVHFVGRVRLGGQVPPTFPVEVPAPAPGEGLLSEDIYRLYFHGPAYRVIDLAWREGSAVIGRLAEGLPPNHLPDERPVLMAPRLIELCFQTAGLWEIGQTGRLGLPWRVESVSTHRSAEAAQGRVMAVVQPRSDGSFDAKVVDQKGHLLANLTGYRTAETPVAVGEGVLARLRSALG